MAQAVHAMADFFAANPVTASQWHSSSNYLVIVAVPDEGTLNDLALKALALGIIHQPVYEPDLDDSTTAIAFTPGDAARRLLSQYPLALREVKPAAA